MIKNGELKLVNNGVCLISHPDKDEMELRTNYQLEIKTNRDIQDKLDLIKDLLK